MVDQDQLEELLVDWSMKRKQGIDLSAQELCENNPELIPQLQGMIDDLKRMDWLDDEHNSRELGGLSLNSGNRLNPGGRTRIVQSGLSVDEFARRLVQSGLMTLKSIEQLRKQSDASDGSALAAELIKMKKLTRYQADVLLEGKEQPLLLDRYIILDEIGSGGMGVVYKALHRKMDRIVAIKILPKAAVDTPEKVQRFQREVKAVARLEHPNIVTAHDAHESNGIHYLVMSYVAGSDLSAFVKQHGPLPVEQAIEDIIQVANGLGHAHAMGIIHRDIKPSNLLLNLQGEVKILDMGLARFEQKICGSNHEKSHDLTHTGMIMGTVAYLAPEQALDTRNADARSDIYSLGCTLFYLLTGQVPFQAATMMKTILAHREGAIPSLADYRDSLPVGLNAVFQKMVAKNPAERFQSTAEVVTALEAIQSPAASESQPLGEFFQALQDTDKFLETRKGRFATKLAEKKQTTQVKKSKWKFAVTVLCGLVLLLAGLLIMLQTPAGTLVLEMDQPELVGAVVTVDGQNKITIKTGEGEEEIEIVPDSKTHQLLITQAGFKTFSKEFTFKTAEKKSIRVRLEPKGVDLAAAGSSFEVVRSDPPAMKEPLERNADSKPVVAKAENDDLNRNETAAIEAFAAEGNFLLHFDGIDDYVDLGTDLTFDQNAPMTFEAWVRIDGNTEQKWQTMISGSPHQLGLHDNSHKWQYIIREQPYRGATQGMIRLRDSRLQMRQFYHIAGVWQGNEKGRFLKLFVNGVLIGSEELKAPLVFEQKSGVVSLLGADTLLKTPYGVFKGLMDEVRISNIARYDVDFTPAHRFNGDNHTLALYHFDEAEGDVLKDSSGNGHHGKIHGANWYRLKN